MPDITVTVQDSLGNQAQQVVTFTTTGGVTPITGTFTSSFVTTPGLIYELQGAVNFNGCSLMVKGAELRMAQGAILTINPQGAAYLNGAPVDEAQMSAEPGLYFYAGGKPNITLPQVVHRRLDGVGDDPTWLSTDTLVSGPRTHGSITASAFTKGATVPLDAESGLPVGIFNVTRRGIIQGVAGDESYIVFMPDAGVPIMEGVQLRYLGRQSAYPIGTSNNSGQPGKFSTHFHRMKDGSRGGRIQNCVYINCKNQGLWPHNCHGLSWRNNLVYRTERQGAAWDKPTQPNNGDLADTRSDDLYYEGNHFLQIEHVQDIRAWADGFVLSQGSNNVIGPGNAISGVNGRGVVWPEINLANITLFPWVWDNSIAVDHCTPASSGDRAAYDLWLNGPPPDTFPVRVHSSGVGLRLGAYSISEITALIDDIGYCAVGISQHAQTTDRGDGYGLRVLGPGAVHHSLLAAIRFQKHVPPPVLPVLYKDLIFNSNPTIIEDVSAENSGIYPSIADFVECTLDGQPMTSYLTAGQNAPAIVFTAPNAVAGAQFRVQNGATAFLISGVSGAVTSIGVFYP